MRTRVVRPDGRVLPEGVCVDPSNHVDTFTVVIRSIGGVTPEDMQKIIEKHYETVRVLHDDRTTVTK